MNASLKPCHKCGAPALVENGNTDETWKIVCSREGCTCKPINYTGNYQSRAAAVRKWNKRRAVAAGEG